MPVVGVHLDAFSGEPVDIAHLVATVGRSAVEEAPAPEHRVSPPQRCHRAGELQHVGVLPGVSPVDPRDVVVLAVGVVIAALGAAYLVTVTDHRRALRQ